VFRAFAERAVRAVLDPRCADLPLPQSMLGKTDVLTFQFKP
jgi:neural Wiskott-Aldrich syndrome protein